MLAKIVKRNSFLLALSLLIVLTVSSGALSIFQINGDVAYEGMYEFGKRREE